MALENRLELRLLQKLILTPQLQQAIKLLQMPQLELSQTITNELVENPFLEEASEESSEEPAPEDPAGTEPAAEEGGEIDDAEFPLEKLMMNLPSDDYFEERGLDGRDLGYFTPGYVQPTTSEHYANTELGLHEHLLWQLSFSDTSPAVRSAGEAVIGNIDDNGYLRTTVDDIVASAGCTVEDALRAIRLIQTFDPPGVGAKDVKECLSIQLKALGLEGSLPEKIVCDNLEDIEKKQYKLIASRQNCTLNEVMQAIQIISSLEPKPGSNFSSEPPSYIAPDVYIVKTEDGYRIVLNDEHMPSLRINGYYRRLLLQKNSFPKEERQYLEDKLRSAVWLLKSLDHRNKTIYRVAESILTFQRSFFDGGASHLAPLCLKDVAADLEMHESTISRATSNKYLSCSHGTFSFKFFFNIGITSTAGMVSSTAVKEMIRRIISEESPKHPLSDQKIVELLREQSITVARRTVAKYRDKLNIAPQMQRKRTNSSQTGQ